MSTTTIPFPMMPVVDLTTGKATPEWYRFFNSPELQDAAFPALPTSTDGLPEGSSNLYFTDARAQTAIGDILLDTQTIGLTYDGTNILADFIGSAIDVPVTSSNFEVLIGSSVQDALDRADDTLLNESSTGIRYGMQLTINADPTKVDVSAGVGQILDSSTPDNPTFARISFAGATGVAVSNTSTPITYWYVDSTGTLQQTTTKPTATEHRTQLILGQTNYNGGGISQVVTSISPIQHPIGQIYDLFRVLGSMTNDIYPYANGVNLNFNVSAGSLASYGANFFNNSQDPNFISFGAKIPATFRYGTQTTPGTTGTTTVDGSNYDVSGTITPIPGAGNRFTAQVVWLTPAGDIRVQYGQHIYTSIASALANLATDSFVQNPDYASDGHIIGAIVVKDGATDLSDTTQAAFVTANKFGEFGSQSSSSASVVSFNGRTGIVLPVAGDYNATDITFDNSIAGITATEVQDALAPLLAGILVTTIGYPIVTTTGDLITATT